MKHSGKIGSAILLIITRPLSLLPLGFHRACGRFLGRFAGKVLRYRRHVVDINLARCFPEKSYDEILQISKKFYEHFAVTFTEAIWLGSHTTTKRIIRNHFGKVTNPEVLNKVLERGKSVIMLTSHSGNWESIGAFIDFEGPEPLNLCNTDFVAVYRKLSSPTWERFMYINRQRPVSHKKDFDGLVQTTNVIRYILQHQKEKKLYFFISDQYPYGEYKIPVRFMGQNTYTMTGGAALAHKLGLPVVYYSMRVGDDGNYIITNKVIAEDGSKCEIADMVQKYYDCLEEDLREQPWNYLWTHKRWK